MNKTVLITGATSGIGKATAKVFAENGAGHLILCGRRMERLEALEAELSDYKQLRITRSSFDIRNYAEVEKNLQSLGNELESIDILINNAGLAKGLDLIHQGQLKHWEEMIDTNLKGLLYVTRLVSPFMVARNSGHIINICSTAGKDVYPKGNVYSATKFAVDALTKAMRQDLYGYNIRVSQVAPGHVEQTEFALTRFDGDAERSKIYEDFKPLNARDVAEIIYFICSRPSHVNIQDVLVMCAQQASASLIHRSGRS
ncbi:MAG: SDR family NAD(P)-dependent oxidoreductase [Saprospiraceae bacterium]|nr:SDR family NAD(P)-dependent oxidoreductase [Saprospiraceae bacterium]